MKTRYFLGLFFEVCLVILLVASMHPLPAQQKETKGPVAQVPIEYVGGACWDNIFTVEHIIVDRDKGTLTIDYFMPAANQVQHEDNPYIFGFKVEPETDLTKGLIKFGGDVVVKGHEDELKDHKVSIHGLINPANKRYVAITVVDDQPGHFQYGAEGSVDDMIKLSEGYHIVCGRIHQLPQGLIPTFLRNWLEDEKY